MAKAPLPVEASSLTPGRGVPIAIVGEAWGEHEERQRRPFVGPTGSLLTRILREAGIERSECFLTNVLNLRPPQNKIEHLCTGKRDAIEGYPALVKGKYLHARYQPELTRLANELEGENPNLVLCLGNTALWALTGRTAITKNRGTTLMSTHTISGFKTLPSYHPAVLFRDQWNLRPTLVADLHKARRESAYPEIRRPQRTIFIPETPEELNEWIVTNLTGSPRCAVDIETAGTQITCIGFAPSRECAIVIPFTDGRSASRSYWKSKQDEQIIMGTMRSLLSNQKPEKVFQNGLYDIAFIFRAWGIKVLGATEDTMLLHHALQPEALKSLGYLGSIYTDEGSWKQMRGKIDTIKRDE